MNIDATHSNAVPVVWKSAQSCTVTDINNKEYIDFTSSIFVANCGHGAVAEYIKEQADKVIHCYTYETPIKTAFLKKLKNFLPDFVEKIYLASAGSEVTNWAERLMRNYKKKKVIVHFEGAFHGKIGADDRQIILKFPEEDEDWRYAWEILESHKECIAGVMIETYKGWTAQFLPKKYVQILDSFCKTNDIPICFDEIQSGFYRTGKKFGYEWYEVEPDLMCLGKALGGGMPLSALVGRAKYFTFPDMSSTHTGHALCCAGGFKALEIYESVDAHDFKMKCNYFRAKLALLKNIFQQSIVKINDKGLVAAIFFKTKEFADKVTLQCMKNGLLVVNTGKEAIKLGPPIVIPPLYLDEGLQILEKSIGELENEQST